MWIYKMKRFSCLILLALIFQLSLVAGFDPAAMNPQSKVHSTHVGPGTIGLNCDTCHGFPASVVKVNEMGTKPGDYIVCENCHAAPPDSMKPSMGNLIVIHLSRSLYCTNCHDTASIVPSHPSGNDIKCENCHANPQNSISHVNGGKYCLDCHGNNTTAYIAPTRTPLIIAVSPTSTPSIIPVSTYTVSTAKVRVIVELQRGFTPATQTIKAGDEIIWRNDGRATVTLASSDGLFNNRLLEYDKEYRYVFNKQGVYSFYLNENKNLKGTIIVESVSTPAPTVLAATPITSAEPKKRAQLQVTYEVGAGRTKQELTVSVHLKNVGNATASRVELSIENPPELQASVLSGSEQAGNIITWRGEIESGKEHVAKYAVKIVTGKSIEVPLKVTYAKVSPEEKARELGISTSEVSAALSPEEMELITIVIKIGLSAIPGFEGIMAIALVLSAVVIIRKRR